MAKKSKNEKGELVAVDNQSAGKMTIYEYEQKYVKRQNLRGAKAAIRFIAVTIGIFIFFCLFSLTMDVYKLNKYAGYGAAVVSVVLYVAVFIIPLVKILKSDYFITNVNAATAREAQKHNKKLRHDVAEKMIDFTAKVEGVGWYDSEAVGRLAIALSAGDENALKQTLTELYSGSIKRSGKDLIFKSALKSATYSAVSQTSRVDAMLVAVVNLQLIKDLIFLYGFRPSDVRLVKIFGKVLQNSLAAYGLGGMQIGHSVAKTMGNAVKGIPILGSAIAAIVDSSVQGLANGTLTMVIGFQTIKYLNEEYNLQNILDGIEVVETQAELEEACNSLEKELRREKRAGKAAQTA